MNDRIQIVYIAGWGRAGSTILGQLLGQTAETSFVGELQYYWDRGIVQNRICSCGERFDHCDYWREIAKNAFGGTENIDTRRLQKIQNSIMRTRNILHGRAKFTELLDSADGRYYLDCTRKLYEAIHQITGSRVIVDTSKNPSYATLLDAIPSFEVSMVHLVRDPRAAAYSWWMRPKPAPDKGPNQAMARSHPMVSTFRWIIWNHLINSIWGKLSQRYILVRYEEMANDIENILRTIIKHGPWDETIDNFEGNTVAKFAEGHTISGNPVRFSRENIVIREDDEWKTSMSSGHKFLVSAMTSPWMKKYGYSVFEF